METLFSVSCTETVSILYALILGAGDACVSISAGSILTAFAAFMVLVVIGQFFARRLWAKLTRRERRSEDFADTTDGYESPIKKTRF